MITYLISICNEMVCKISLVYHQNVDNDEIHKLEDFDDESDFSNHKSPLTGRNTNIYAMKNACKYNYSSYSVSYMFI